MRQFLDKIFPTLHLKIAASIVLVLSVVGGGFVYYAMQTGRSLLAQQADAKAHSIAEFGKVMLEQEMLIGNNDKVREVLVKLSQSTQAKEIIIVRADGSIALNQDIEDTTRRLPIELFQEKPELPGEKFLDVVEGGKQYEYILTPIYKKDACLKCHSNSPSLMGYVASKINIEDIQSLGIQHRTMNIIMSVVMFAGLGGVVYLALLFLVVRPVTKMKSQMQDIYKQIESVESGNRVKFSSLPVPASRDEITDLILTFNKLVEKLNTAHEKLYELHEKQLEQADRLATVGEMAASMAHEIKNPIAGVLGAVQIFDSELPADDARKEIFSEMKVQLERVNHAVTDLLSYARPTPPIFEEVHVNEVIQRTYSMLSKQIRENRIAVTLNLSEETNHISADKKQIQQVLWNVMLNAVQSIEGSGSVTISSVREHNAVVCTVSDSGKGIAKECLNQVFKPFFTTKHKGTGLGMTITKRIIEQHGGMIELLSEVGKGTTVRIVLPQGKRV
ncbi:MAG: hypothetical protein HY960_06400 [Ignavibacteriae bacterium]|nr:hypothetical protein [Ignavibacteriota bacterium]